MRWAFLNFQEQTEADAEGKFVFPSSSPARGKFDYCQWTRVDARPMKNPLSFRPDKPFA